MSAPSRPYGALEAKTMEEGLKRAFHYDDEIYGHEGRRGWHSFPRLTSTDMAKENQSHRHDSRDSRPKYSDLKGWKPLSLSAPILFFVIAFTILIAIAIETLAQRSKALGGLALSPTLDDIPTYAMLSYLYAPNLAAVIYSLVWSWIDLDAKRMQPWFELSKPGGAVAKNSLFLEYQYDFVAWAPFKAAKRRHWPVFLSGTIMVVVLWVLTPLQSALLGARVVQQTKSVHIRNRSVLRPLSEQAALLDGKVLRTAYTISWFNQRFPPFTTSNYAILPYYPKDDAAPSAVDTNWTATTTKLSTELDCRPAEYSQGSPFSGNITFTVEDGQGCNVNGSFQGKPDQSWTTIWYHTYLASAFSDRCELADNSTHQFVALWARSQPESTNNDSDISVTALYCQASYYQQAVVAQVRADNLRPHDKAIEAVGPKQPLTDREFNITAFNRLLSSGSSTVIAERDAPFLYRLDQEARLDAIGSGFSDIDDNVVGFALAGRNDDALAYSDPETLGKALNIAHQRLFSVAVNQLLINTTTFSNTTASSSFPLVGVVVSRPISVVSESILVLVAIAACVLLRRCRTSPCKLQANPSSTSRLIEVARNSPQVIQAFGSVDIADEKSLKKAFEDYKVRLEYNAQAAQNEILVERPIKGETKTPEQSLCSQGGYYRPAKPLILRWETGVGFMGVFIAAITVLFYLKEEERKQQGLRLPSDDHEVLQILENYLPTIFATLLEPIWILLARFLCALQPFRDLWTGKAKPSDSIDTTYTSNPLQLVIFRALKSKHFILILVCFVALLSNVLAVGMGALFNEEPIMANYPEAFRPEIGWGFRNNTVVALGTSGELPYFAHQDHAHIVAANLSIGTTLPPWVSTDYFFQPFRISGLEKNSPRDTYVVTSRGFGVNANCTPIPTAPVPTSFLSPGVEQYPECPGLLDTARAAMRDQMLQPRPDGRAAIEYSSTFTRTVGPCMSSLTLGWGRTALAQDVNASADASFLICRPAFQTGLFDVTINRNGYVLGYESIDNITSMLDYPDYEQHAQEIIWQSNRLITGGATQWHSDTMARTWMSYLIVLATGNRATLDALSSAPGPTEMVPVVENLYRRLFVALLSINPQVFAKPEQDDVTIGTRQVKEARIFMNQPAFVMSMTVLGMNLVAAAIFYFRAVEFVLPRMPTSIGSTLAYIAPSRALRWERSLGINGQNRTFSFGRYIGLDGDVHLGIELDPHVVPIDPKSLKERGVFAQKLIGRKSELHHARQESWL